MKAIKGFDENLKCRDFQYEIGKTYTIDEDKVEICKCGFHAIHEDSDPMNVFDYYPPTGENGTKSRYCEVELNGVIKEDNKKAVSSSITIVREIGINGVIAAHEAFVKANLIDDSNEQHNTGDRSSASNTGDQSSASNTGNRSSASNTGNFSSASNTGNYSIAEVSGKDSVAIATGYQCKAKGALGCAIVVAERGEWNGETYPLLAICAAIVDGEKIKADTWYTAKNGELVEVEK